MELTNIIYNVCYSILGTFSLISGEVYEVGEVGLALMFCVYVISLIFIFKMSVSAIRWIFQI